MSLPWLFFLKKKKFGLDSRRKTAGTSMKKTPREVTVDLLYRYFDAHFSFSV